MSSHRQLAFAAWSDPLSPANWSGTSAHLAGAMRKQGVEVLGLDCQVTGLAWKAERSADYALGRDTGFTRRRIARRRFLQLVKTLPPTCADVIHTGSWTVPPRGTASQVRHFLLCDATNRYWQTASPLAIRKPSNIAAAERGEVAAVAGADEFFPISQHTAASLREDYGVDANLLTVVGTGRGQIAALRTSKDYSRKNLPMVAKGRFEDKGGPLLLDALEIARKTDPQLHLTLVSPLEYASFVGNREGVTLTGHLEWPELQRLFDEACLYAMPALCEPWGLVYAEALATKTPVLGLNRAALPELTGEGRFGFLVDEATPRAVARALLDAVSNPEQLREMGEAGQKYCLEAFSWDRTASLMLDRVFGAR